MAITMISHKLCCYVSILVVPFLAQLASGDVLWQECDNSWNYTANNAFQSNLKQLSTTLPTESSSSPTLFATAAVGAIPDTVYALSVCRGDTTNASACGDCVANAFRDAQQVCSYNMDVTIYYDPCFLRFSNQNFLNSIDNTKRHIMPNGENVTSPAATFDAAVGILLAAVADYAALNSSTRFGTGVEDFDVSTPRIYALAQCTPDMAPADCRSCLEGIVSVMPKHFSRRQGGRIGWNRSPLSLSHRRRKEEEDGTVDTGGFFRRTYACRTNGNSFPQARTRAAPAVTTVTAPLYTPSQRPGHAPTPPLADRAHAPPALAAPATRSDARDLR